MAARNPDLAVVGPRPVAACAEVHVSEHDGVGLFRVGTCRGVLDLQVQVRFVGVAVVPDRGERLAASHVVAHLDGDAAL